MALANVIPQTEAENLAQGTDRDKHLEEKHKNRIWRFLKSINIDVNEKVFEGGDIQAFLSKLPFQL